MNDTLKKVIIIISVCLGIGIIGGILYGVYYTKDYWKTQIDVQNEELHLRTEESVDSLVKSIQYKDSVIHVQDSILSVQQLTYDSIEHRCDSIVNYYKVDNKKLLDIINHQNQMISNLSGKK